MHRKVAAAIVAALAFGLASCGSSQGPELTRAQLVSRIESACRAGRVAGEQYARTHRENEGSVLQFLSVMRAGQQVVADKLGDLNPPDSEQADLDAFRQGVQDRIDFLDRVTSGGRAGVERALRTAQAEGEAITERVKAAIRRLGVKVRDDGCT